MSFEKAKAQLLKWEKGKYVPKLGDRNNDPNPTQDGVIQKTYDRYRRGKGLPLRSVYLIEAHEWDEIFTKGFWGPAGCADLPEPLDMLVADCAFNSGPVQSLKFLQRAVGAVPDGVWGPKTKEAVLRSNVREMCISVIGQRIRFLKSIYERSIKEGLDWDSSPELQAKGPRPEPFPLEGVMNRVKDLQKAARY
jgi:Putative secretion activating protein